MQFHTIDCARAMRDGGIDAMAALDDALADALSLVPEAEHRELKQAVGRAMSAIMSEMIHPAVRAFPDLEPTEEIWRSAVKERLGARATKFLSDD